MGISRTFPDKYPVDDSSYHGCKMKSFFCDKFVDVACNCVDGKDLAVFADFKGEAECYA